MIYSIGIAISIFLALILFTKRNKTTPDIILGVWLIITAVHLGIYTLIITGEFVHYPHLFGLEKPITLSHGSFLFLYTKSLTSGTKMRWNVLYYFSPSLLSLLVLIPFFLNSASEKLRLYTQDGAGLKVIELGHFIAIILSGIIFIALSFRELYRHKKRISEQFSATEKINLQWLTYLIFGLSIIWVFVFWGNDQFIFITVVVYVIFLGFFGIRQVGIFSNPTPSENEVVAPSTNSIIDDEQLPLKYGNSQLSEEDLSGIHVRLVEIMRRKKLFVTPELTLAMVADALAVHPNVLSEVINRVEGKSFFDYVNTLRVEEFKAMVGTGENLQYTMLAIAFDCGFNSKTSFNRNFKTITGMTPSAYVASLSAKH